MQLDVLAKMVSAVVMSMQDSKVQTDLYIRPTAKGLTKRAESESASMG